MENKILILLMSCNEELYLKEEQACRDTFLKDAEKEGIAYFFYKGGEELKIDTENHVIYLPVEDNLSHTAEKTTQALSTVLNEFKDWDYIIKTNVSTWLDIKKIVETVNTFEGRDDLSIYGARFLANEFSKRVPFPRGHFTILSRKLVEGIAELAPKFIGHNGIPKTDDTLLCLTLLYYIQKSLGDSYLARLREVPSICEWYDDIESAPEYATALSIRCKNEKEKEKAPDRMLAVHSLKHKKTKAKKYCRKVNLIETKYGLMTYEKYNKLNQAVEEAKKAQQQPQKVVYQDSVVKRTDSPNKLEEIRKRLEGLKK